MAAFQNPSLSELLAPGQSRLGTIQNDANAFTNTANEFPKAMDRYEQGKSKAEEEARNNRPVTPWEKAAARLLAGHDPKAVAADTKALLAGQSPSAGPSAAAPMPQAPVQNLGPISQANMQVPQLPQSGMGIRGMGGAMPQQPAPQISSSPMSSAQFNADSAQQPSAPQGMQSGAQAQSQAQQLDLFEGATHRDWQDYISAMEKGHAAQVNKAQRDYIEELRMKIEGEKAVQTQKNEGAATVQDKKGATAETVANTKAMSATERINQKRAEMLTKHQDYQDYLQVLRDKQASWERTTSGKAVADPNLKALTEKAKATTNAFAKIGSANILDLTPEGQKQSEKLKEEAAIAWAKVEAYTAANPHTVTTTQTQSSGQKNGGPNATPAKASVVVGQKVTLKNGQTITVSKVNPDGTFE